MGRSVFGLLSLVLECAFRDHLAAGAADCPFVFDNTSTAVCRNDQNAFTAPPTRISRQRYCRPNGWAPFHASCRPGPLSAHSTSLSLYALAFRTSRRQVSCCLEQAPLPSGVWLMLSPRRLVSSRPVEGSQNFDSSFASCTLQLQDKRKM